MPLSKKSFENLELKILATLEGRRVLDVPYYRYLYPPSKEVVCIEMFEKFCDILKRNGYCAETIYLSEIIIKALDNLGFLSKTNIELEEENYTELEDNLKDVLVDEVVDILKEQLQDKDISHCAIFLRTGSIFPFIHVSELLSKMEGYIKCTVIVAYPGSKEGYMLGIKGDKVYYRGESIGDETNAN
jgi:hypothetical protein